MIFKSAKSKSWEKISLVIAPVLGGVIGGVLLTPFALAQNYPSSIDAGRVVSPVPEISDSLPQALPVPRAEPLIEAPPEAEEIFFTLQRVNIKGVSAFSSMEIEALYQGKIGTEITVADIWLLAQNITALYRGKGYFLSRAYIPAQEIEDGIVEIRVVEGFIEKIEFKHSLSESFLVQNLMARVESKKPLKAKELEEFMLRLNDIGGLDFFGSLHPLSSKKEGAVKLVVSEVPVQRPEITLNLDNYGSRYLGPYQGFFSLSDSFSPFHRGTTTFGADMRFNEMQYLATQHEISIAPKTKMLLSASHVRTSPGSSLAVDEIRSHSTSIGVGVSYQPIRQRLKNLSFSASLDGRNSNGDFLASNPLTQDRIRALRFEANYDRSDKWNGYNYLNLTLNQGLEFLGSSKEGTANLSRAEAKPDFFYVSASYIRQQILPSDFVAIGQINGQVSTDPLYSSEEFGYGGANMGRAYDASEILGDSGLAGQIELRYTGVDTGDKFSLTPYVAYDIGKVWNKDTNGEKLSASSAGLGVRFQNDNGLSGHLGVAFPLTKEADKPLYGERKAPRFLLQIQHKF